jgi:hypothetical protein
MAKQFFDMLPNSYYAFDETTILRVKHIFSRFHFFDPIVKKNIQSFDYYTIGEGETPDMVSNKFYKDPGFHWLILMFNDIIDPFGQWPMAHQDLYNYATSKYGVDNIYLTGYHMNAAGKIVDPAHYLGILQSDGTYDQDMIPLSNMDYEELVNDGKRKIYIPKQEYIGAILSNIEKLF